MKSNWAEIFHAASVCLILIDFWTKQNEYENEHENEHENEYENEHENEHGNEHENEYG